MKILLAVPSFDGTLDYRVVNALTDAKERNRSLDAIVQASSALTHNFNRLWCYALNNPPYSHFVMLHSDIVPKPNNWLGKLVNIADAVGADVLSAVAPLKLANGQTSTALAREGEYGNYRRLTMREVMQLPETFNHKDVANLFGWDWGESYLLVNTGLMVVRMRQRDILEQMRFTVNDWIRVDELGKFQAIFKPEDWAWSREAHTHDLSVWATRAVPLSHLGKYEYSNDSAWGIEHDEGK